MADGFLDLHSGGYSMDFIHTAILYRQNTPELMQRAIEAARVWGFPFCLVLDDLGERRTIDALCRDRGLLKVGTSSPVARRCRWMRWPLRRVDFGTCLSFLASRVRATTTQAAISAAACHASDGDHRT